MIVLSVALLIAGPGAAVRNGGGDASSPSAGATQSVGQQGQVQVREPTTITAQQLADAFDANQVAAKKDFGGRYVQFSATISNIRDEGLFFQNVASKPLSITQILCRPTDSKQILTVANGQIVTIRGTVADQTLGIITVRGCEIVK